MYINSMQKFVSSREYYQNKMSSSIPRNNMPSTNHGSVLENNLTALGIGWNISLPADSQIFATHNDESLAHGAIITGIRAMNALSQVSRRLCARSTQTQSLTQEVTDLRNKLVKVRRERKQFKREAKQWKDYAKALQEELTSNAVAAESSNSPEVEKTNVKKETLG